MAKLSMIFPVRRPDKALAAIESVKSSSTRRDVEIVVVTDTAECKEALASLKGVALVHLPVKVKASIAWNEGAQVAKGDWLVPAAEDLFFHPCWWEVLAPHLNEAWGVVGFNDLSGSDNPLATHFAASKLFAVDVLGGVLVPPVYHHAYVDVEVCERAADRHAYVYLDGCHVEHLHPAWGKAEKDALYDENSLSFAQDRATFIYRRSIGFPNAWPPVLNYA